MRRIVPFILVLCLTACSAPADGLIHLKIGDRRLTVEIADSDAERRLGLMYRDFMADDQGMLFVYPQPRRLSFWMKNTKIPLDIAFIDVDGTILQIEQMKPMDMSHTISRKKVRFALEVNQGWFAKHKIKVGEKISGLP